MASSAVDVSAVGTSLWPWLTERRRRQFEAAVGAICPFELDVDEDDSKWWAAGLFDADQHPLYIGFLAGRPKADMITKVVGLRTPVDELHIHGRELYWGCRTRFSDTAVSGAALERALGMPMTMRNVTTVRKLAAKLSS